MKIICPILLFFVILSCKTHVVSKDYIPEYPEEKPLSYTIQSDNSEETLDKITVFTGDGKIIFEIEEIRDVLYYEPNEETIEIIVFETYSKDDFVKICTENSTLGIPAEYAWIRYTYPEYSRVQQSLIEIKINGKTLPCDLLVIKNNNTGELKNIYFEISDFYGKWN
jgi:hypothetical protein